MTAARHARRSPAAGAVRNFAAIVLLLALSAGAAAAGAVEMRAGRTSPGLDGTLPLDGSLFVEVHYAAAQPTRFQARASLRGQPVAARFRVNHAFPDPAGTGTSLVWIALREPAAIDALEIVAYDAEWREIATTRLAVALRWQDAPSGGRNAPQWVLDIEAGKKAFSDGLVFEGAGSPAAIAMAVLGSAIVALLPAYLVLQVWTLHAFSGRWRALAAVPAALMAPLVAFSLFALAAGSGLWPMTLLLAAPLGLAWLAVLWGARRLSRPA